MTRRLLRFLASILLIAGLALAAWGAILWCVAVLPGWLTLAMLLVLAGASVSAAVNERP